MTDIASAYDYTPIGTIEVCVPAQGRASFPGDAEADTHPPEMCRESFPSQSPIVT